MTKIVKSISKYLPAGMVPGALSDKGDKQEAPKVEPRAPMPDIEEQKRIGRRNAANRKGSRSSNIMTGGEDTLG